MRSTLILSLALVPVITASLPAARQPDRSAQKPDYGDPRTWLCRPDRDDACAADQTTTVVAADGRMTREAWRAATDAPIDCFYVYPTVSRDKAPNSDLNAGPEERLIAASQLARFASECRVFAPMYRQVTLLGLRAGLLTRAGGSPERSLAANDVRDAWRYYLEHDNRGRGVVLIGHSQGAFLLTDLIRDEIDGTALEARVISAILLGTSLPVSRGRDSGGVFQHLPLCRRAGQIGCVMTYAAFRSNAPPPANTLFGRVRGDDLEAGCTNPAALGGGSAELRAYLSTAGTPFSSTAAPFAWVAPAVAIHTPFVSVPGLLTARCVSNDHGSYLEVTVHGNPADPRADDIPGDLLTNGQATPSWGLHLIDVNLTIGNLIDRLGDQARAYRAGRGR